MSVNEAKTAILNNKTALGIEFGSTRIKAVLVDDKYDPIASGSYEWENRYENGVWTYSLDDIHKGLQGSYSDLVKDVQEKYGVELTSVGALGISAMMHGYMPFDKDGKLLVPFRTWRNNITGEASEKLMELFQYNIPQRWSIAHLYQAILNGEEHVKDIDYMCTLEAYVHRMLTGKRVLGIGDAAGMFPVDSEKKDYNQEMVEKFDKLVEPYGFPWKLRDIMPEVMVAGQDAGTLTEEGAKFLDPTGKLKAGIPMCPPEGDAGTGMVATNSVKQRTGNVSAGTSVFAMIVLEKALSKPYKEIDMVTTPAGDAVAMAHSNNCTSDLNAWVNVFKEFAEAMGMEVDMNKLIEKPIILLEELTINQIKDLIDMLSLGQTPEYERIEATPYPYMEFPEDPVELSEMVAYGAKRIEQAKGMVEELQDLYIDELQELDSEIEDMDTEFKAAAQMVSYSLEKASDNVYIDGMDELITQIEEAKEDGQISPEESLPSHV